MPGTYKYYYIKLPKTILKVDSIDLVLEIRKLRLNEIK